MLSVVKGWRSSRRYKLVSGKGAAYLALHDWDVESGLGTSREWKDAVATPGRNKLVPACQANGPDGYSRTIWNLVQ